MTGNWKCRNGKGGRNGKGREMGMGNENTETAIYSNFYVYSYLISHKLFEMLLFI